MTEPDPRTPPPRAPLEERQRRSARRLGCALGTFVLVTCGLFLLWKLWN